MKIFHYALLMLGFSFTTHAYEVITPEVRKTDQVWEATIRSEFDFDALRGFLVATIAEQKRKDDVDLTVSRVGDHWKVYQHRRIAISGNWYFVCVGKSNRFQLRYYYGKEYAVVFACERVKKDTFRLIEVRTEVEPLILAYEKNRTGRLACNIGAASFVAFRLPSGVAQP